MPPPTAGDLPHPGREEGSPVRGPSAPFISTSGPTKQPCGDKSDFCEGNRSAHPRRSAHAARRARGSAAAVTAGSVPGAPRRALPVLPRGFWVSTHDLQPPPADPELVRRRRRCPALLSSTEMGENKFISLLFFFFFLVFLFFFFCLFVSFSF